MRCAGDATCQVLDQCASARPAGGADTLCRQLQALCVAAVAFVKVIVMSLLIQVSVGSMMKIVVVDVDVE